MARLLIVNPFASGVDGYLLAQVRSALPADTETHLTSEPGEATQLAASARDAEAIYAFGGDGTFNEILNGAAPTTPLGFIPGGGTSVLPRALGLPRDPIACARALVSATPKPITVGRVNGRRFGFACGIGIDAEVVRAVDELGRRSDGRRPGNLRFAWTGLRVLGRHRFSLEPELEVAGLGRAAFAIVSNGPAYTFAGPVALRPAPRASFEAGLDLVAPVRLRPRDLPSLAWRAVGRGDTAASDEFLHLHDVDRIEIVCDRPLPLEVDGEDLGDVERAEITAERAAVTALVSAP
jgi:diacylglycerol kinase family enzyme